MTQGGNMWFDGFAGPWPAEVAPQAVDSEKTITLVVGAFAAYLLFALGWMLFGVALLRARIGPVWISVAIIVACALGFRSGLPPYGVPIASPWPRSVCNCSAPVPSRAPPMPPSDLARSRIQPGGQERRYPTMRAMSCRCMVRVGRAPTGRVTSSRAWATRSPGLVERLPEAAPGPTSGRRRS